MAKVSIINLGCPKNLVDAEYLLGHWQEQGHQITAEPAKADIVIVNTCSFIRSAKEESIASILKIVELKKKGRIKKIVVAGCLVQEFGPELAKALPEVDVFSRQSPAYLPVHSAARYQLTPAFSAYVKICDGCNNNCSYCLIPSIRGSFRSRTNADIVAEAKQLTRQGVREINLIGQDITNFGSDRDQSRGLARLLRQLVKIKDLRWLRLLYAHPAHLDLEIIRLMAREKKICQFIDLPLQHINDTILRQMNRRVARRQIENLIQNIRQSLPAIALRTTFIVGFPGETESQFQELYDFVQDTRFDRLGVFAYSREEGTLAAAMPGQIPAKIKQQRLKKIMLLQQKIASENNKKLIGRKLTVIIEGQDQKGYYHGRSQYDAPEIDNQVLVHSSAKLRPGTFVQVKITKALPYDLIGETV
ncbi:MAG: 30S ribosomal protein S12 methylthiotransferase RimO [bacterium]|nr:30S ribosomal protein S12 methylthiotransferase RimO [bacterium]MDD5354204.1 30S ribosomal protein S12 methylthiotransferase RimO [bacterium]MDD5756635.1 30S ribosomal protein S12 methylthiotransferase RimO [bacterium]